MSPLRQAGFRVVVFGVLVLASGGSTAALAQVPESRRFEGHKSYARSLAFSPDGRYLLSGSVDSTIRLWDVETGQQVKQLDGHLEEVRSVAFSTDGRWVLSGGQDHTVRLWDLETEEELCRLEEYSTRIRDVTFSADGRRALRFAINGNVRGWDLEQHRQVIDHDGASGSGLARFAPGGDQFLIVDGFTVVLMDTESGEELARFEGSELATRALAFSESGRYLATGGDKESLRLIDRQRGKVLWGAAKLHGLPVEHLAFSPDDRYLLVAMERRLLQLRDTVGGREVKYILGPRPEEAWLPAIAWSPNNRQFAAATGDKALLLYDIPPGLELCRMRGHTRRVAGVALTPDGQLAVSSSHDGTIRVWNTTNGQEVRRLEGHQGKVNAMVLTPDGRQVVSGGTDKSVRLWDLETGEELQRFDGHREAVLSVAVSRDGRRVVSAGGVWALGEGRDARLMPSDCTVRSWDMASGRAIASFEGHTGPVKTVAVSRDGELVLAGSEDRTARLWDLETGEELQRFEAHTGDVTGVVLTPDGKSILTVGLDGAAWLTDIATRAATDLMQRPGYGEVRSPLWSAAISDDGRWVLIGGPGVCQIDVATKEREIYLNEDPTLGCLGFSADGRQAISGSMAGTVRLWALPKLR